MKLDQPATPRGMSYAIESFRVLDGDTIQALVHIGLDTFTRTKLRLRGFYAPELDGQNPGAGRAAAARLGEALLLHVLTFEQRGLKKDNYGRWLVNLLIDGTRADPRAILGDLLLTEEQHRNDLAFAKRNRTKNGGAL